MITGTSRPPGPPSALTRFTGPIIGGDLGPHSNVPRAVSREYFYKVCPNPTVIHPSEVKVKEIPDYTAAQTLDAWVEKINSIEDRCIEIPKDTDRLFDIWQVVVYPGPLALI